jgi:hypothetical protein
MIGFALWAALFAAVLALEGLGLTLRGHEWPTISDVFRSATRPVIGRWAFFAFWLWAGWHFFIRGWQFFLRGPGAADPGPGALGGGKTLGTILSQVVVPLAAVYLLVAIMLFVGYRSWHAGAARVRVPFGRAASLMRERPLAFVRYTLGTIVGGYVVFVGVLGLYQLLVGGSAGGITASALAGGAFLAFALALPAFLVLSFAESAVAARARPHRDRPTARRDFRPTNG